MKQPGERYSGQGEVWDDIDLKSRKFSASSGTSAMSDIFEGQTAALEDYVGAFAHEKVQTWILFGTMKI